MTANAQHRYPEALGLARQALEYADTPLRRAHLLAWGICVLLAPVRSRLTGAGLSWRWYLPGSPWITR